ncbi:MAG: hypothetical protein AB1730_06815 [Myxococcota bacterium]|jgi:hypothetical protein
MPKRLAAPLALVTYVLLLFGATHALQAGLFERDGYYHARLSRLVPERGFSREFPWTQVSTWKHGYCDKEVLYHAAMMPFALVGDEPIGGARVFATLLSAAVLLGLFFLLRAHGVPWPALFAALPLASGGLFIARLGMIRSHVLSMLLLLAGVHLVLQRRWRATGVLGFVYAWSYTLPFVLALTAAPIAVGRALSRAGLDWRTVLAAFGGACLGLALHPYSPLTLETFLTIAQIVRMGLAGKQASGFELGNEIYPYPPAVFFNIYPLVVLLVPALVLVVAWQWKRVSADARGVVLATLAWSAMTALSARYVEYQVLLLALACGLVARDLSQVETWKARWAASGRLRVGVTAAALLVLVGFHVRAMTFYWYYQAKAAPARFFDGAGKWMAEHLAPGETVINLYWDDFPDLFYSAPRQHYLWGLDPTFTVRADEGRATLLERVRTRQLPLDGALLAKVFSSRTLVFRATRASRYPELTRAPFREVYRDASAVLYRIE